MGRKYKSKKRKYSKKIKKHLRSHKRKRSMKKRRGGGRGRQGPGGWTTWEDPGSRPPTVKSRPAPPPAPVKEESTSSKHTLNPKGLYWERSWPKDDPGDTTRDHKNVFRKGTGELVRPRPSSTKSPTKSSTKSLIGKKKSRPTIYGPCKICRKGKGNCTKRGQSGHLKTKKH